MAVGPDRVATARALIEHSDCDVILSDDGLQHYALQRDIEIIVIDGVRRFGTGFSLPAGPLREPVKRLQEADLVVINGLGSSNEHQMRMNPGDVCNLLDAGNTRRLSDFHGQAVHAVAVSATLSAFSSPCSNRECSWKNMYFRTIINIHPQISVLTITNRS